MILQMIVRLRPTVDAIVIILIIDVAAVMKVLHIHDLRNIIVDALGISIVNLFAGVG